MKNGEIYHLWEYFEDLYRYKCGTALQNRTCTGIGAVQVRYSFQNRTCTGTGQSYTGTGSALFLYFN